jgi:carbon monoxide dehydrogenase subunit G
MPGAKIVERLDERRYKGTVAVKFGPANMSFRGEIEVLEVDAATRTLRLAGKGTDSTGGSGAAMDLTARLDAGEAASCTLVGASEVSVSGKAASFGGRMMGSVADQVLKQFAANFAAQVHALQAATAAPPAPQPPAPPSTGDATAAPVAGPTAGSSADRSASAATDGSAAAPTASAAAIPPPQPTQLNALALLWAIVRDWFRSLVGRKGA